MGLLSYIKDSDREVLILNTKKLINQLKPPCPKCPYTLGLVHTTVKSPCPECKDNGYQIFERFKRIASGESMSPLNEGGE